jgi:hypothetical protein
MRMAVVLPAPLGPSSTVIFAVGTSRCRSLSAGFSPNDRETPDITTVDAAGTGTTVGVRASREGSAIAIS